MRKPRRAFTLFQLLVLLALFVLLLGLLLPALLKVRAAAARAQSQNNLKQIALACHNYNDVNNSFPPGNDANNFSAASRLLPYLEQDQVYQLIKFDKPCTDADNAVPRALVLKVFLDPQDPGMMVEQGSGPTNYLFNAGSKAPLEDNDGVFYQDSKIKFTDITDGTSNTMLAGETLRGDGSRRARDVQRQYVALDKDALKELKDEAGVQDFKNDRHTAGDRCARWIDGRFLQGTFTATRSANDSRPDVSCGGIGGLSGLRSLENTVNVALCDGSVRAVKVDLKFTVWQLLAGRNDGQVLPDF